MQSYATLVHNSRSSRPEVIVSVNHALRYESSSSGFFSLRQPFLFFLSDVEAKHLQLSVDQVEKTPTDYMRSAQASGHVSGELRRK